MVGACEEFRSFERRLIELAASDVSLLIEGESGSGKNLAARFVHDLGSRASAPFVEVPLAALSPALIEAELFGHAQGAFTGAHVARTGRFLRAQHGAIVLDGIESLPNSLQVKLLRVLQERVVEPVGGQAEIPVDVRVVATSSVDLAGEVRAGRFREDLYYRLAVVTVRVPPLRARLADLPLLCDHILERASQRLSVARRPLTAAALERLATHGWPGNLRELENTLERVLVIPPSAPLAATPAIEASELEFLSEVAAGVPERLARSALAHGIGLEALEQAVLAEALREQRGNVNAAARQLGLSRRAFEYRSARPKGTGSRAPGDASAPDS